MTIEDTLLLLTTGLGGVPEVEMLLTGGGESVLIWVPGAVVDDVGITLLLEDTVA